MVVTGVCIVLYCMATYYKLAKQQWCSHTCCSVRLGQVHCYCIYFALLFQVAILQDRQKSNINMKAFGLEIFLGKDYMTN